VKFIILIQQNDCFKKRTVSTTILLDIGKNLNFSRKSLDIGEQLLVVGRSQSSHGIPPNTSIVPVVAACAAFSTFIGTNGNVVEGFRSGGCGGVQHGIQETKGGLASVETSIVQESGDTCDDGCGSTCTLSNSRSTTRNDEDPSTNGRDVRIPTVLGPCVACGRLCGTSLEICLDCCCLVCRRGNEFTETTSSGPLELGVVGHA